MAKVWALIAICLITFIAIAILSARIFEHVPHSEDEVAYIFQAKVFAQNRLAVPTPPYDDAFWTPFVVDYQDQRFGKYPIGWPLWLSIGIRLNAPWLVNALLATFTLALIAWLGFCFYCDYQRDTVCYVPIMAAGLGLVTPGFLFLSSSLLSHTASLFWITITLLALYHLTPSYTAGNVARETGQTRHLPPATCHLPLATHPLYATLVGLSLAATFLTRPFAALGIGLAVGGFILVLFIRGELKWRVLLWLLLGGLPLVVLHPLYWWAVTGNPTFNAYLLVWPYDRIGFGPDIGPYGYSWREAIFINTRLKLTTLATGLFGWPGWTNLLFLPIPFLARQANRWDWLLLGTLVGMVVVHIFYWSFGGVDGGFPRYYYDALPALLLLTARGLQLSVQYLGRWRRQWRWLPVALVAGFIGYNLVWNLPPLLAAQKGKYNITPAPLQAVEQAELSEPALIVVKDVESWSDFAAPFAANSPTLDGPIVYAIDWGPKFTQQLRAHFSGRDCWELQGRSLRRCPIIEGQ